MSREVLLTHRHGQWERDTSNFGYNQVEFITNPHEPWWRKLLYKVRPPDYYEELVRGQDSRRTRT